MKNKSLTKRQILFGVCCLLFFISIVSGMFLAYYNSSKIDILNTETNIFFTKEFFDVFKYLFIALVCGFIPEANIFLYFLVVFKGLSIGFTAYSIAEINLLKRLLQTSSFIFPELISTFYIIFCTSYFSSYNIIKNSSKRYTQEKRKRTEEIIILIIAAFVFSFVCAFWKIIFANIIYNH